MVVRQRKLGLAWSVVVSRQLARVAREVSYRGMIILPTRADRAQNVQRGISPGQVSEYQFLFVFFSFFGRVACVYFIFDFNSFALCF